MPVSIMIGQTLGQLQARLGLTRAMWQTSSILGFNLIQHSRKTTLLLDRTSRTLSTEWTPRSMRNITMAEMPQSLVEPELLDTEPTRLLRRTGATLALSLQPL
jgi:hypothetical protein